MGNNEKSSIVTDALEKEITDLVLDLKRLKNKIDGAKTNVKKKFYSKQIKEKNRKLTMAIELYENFLKNKKKYEKEMVEK